MFYCLVHSFFQSSPPFSGEWGTSAAKSANRAPYLAPGLFFKTSGHFKTYF